MGGTGRQGKIRTERYGGCKQRGHTNPCCGEGANRQNTRARSSRQDPKHSRKAKSPRWGGRREKIRKERKDGYKQKRQRPSCCGEAANRQNTRVRSSCQDPKNSRQAESPRWGGRRGKIRKERKDGYIQKRQRPSCCGEGTKRQHRRTCSSRQDPKNSRKAKSPRWGGRRGKIRQK